MTRRASAAIACLLVFGAGLGCRRRAPDDIPRGPAFTNPAPLPTKREFNTIVMTMAHESLMVFRDGSVLVQSTATVRSYINAEKNKYRIEIDAGNGQKETEFFDGKRIWKIYPGDKIAYGQDPPWPDYQVWEQAKPYEMSYAKTEVLRGLPVLLMRTDASSVWVYKGVIVQADMRDGDMVVRNSLQDIKVDVPVDPLFLEVPKGYKKEFVEM